MTSKLTIITICVQLSLLSVTAGNKDMIKKQQKELSELAQQLNNQVDLKKYNNKTIYIKAEVSPTENRDYKVKVKSVTEIPLNKARASSTTKSVMIKAYITSNDGNVPKLYISNPDDIGDILQGKKLIHTAHNQTIKLEKLEIP